LKYIIRLLNISRRIVHLSNTFLKFSTFSNFWWNNNFYFLIRMNQICLKWIKMDQTWSNWISDKIIIEIYHQIFNLIYFLMRLNQICPKWIKMDQVDQIAFLYHPWFTKASFGSSPQYQYKTYFFDMKLNL